jgi:hypothetical protein
MMFFLNTLKSIRNFFYENYEEVLFTLLLIIISYFFYTYAIKLYFLIKYKPMYLQIIEDYKLFVKVFNYNPLNPVLNDAYIDIESISKFRSAYCNMLAISMAELLDMLPEKYKTIGVVEYLTNAWWGADIFGKIAIKIFLIGLITEIPISDNDVSWLLTLLIQEAKNCNSICPSPYITDPSSYNMGTNSQSKISSLLKEDLSLAKDSNLNQYYHINDTSLPKDINFEELDSLILFFQSLNKKPISEVIISENIVPKELTYYEYWYNTSIYIIEVIKDIIF